MHNCIYKIKDERIKDKNVYPVRLELRLSVGNISKQARESCKLKVALIKHMVRNY